MEYRSVSPSTTVMTVTFPISTSLLKVVQIPTETYSYYPPDYSKIGRVLYIKAENSDIPFDLSNSSCNQYVLIEAPNIISGTAYFSNASLQSITLQQSPLNNWTRLYAYGGAAVFSTMEMPSPTSVAVNASGSDSALFVDLTYHSKALVLPPIHSLTNTPNSGPYFTVKDVYGKANTKPLFISTSGGATIDGLGPSIAIRNPFASLELVGDLPSNRWHILNYYSGNFPDATPGPQITSEYTISSAIVNVNVSSIASQPGTSKVLYLPPASTVNGQSFMIRDVTGYCNEISSIFISTTGLDTIDIQKTFVQLSSVQQSFRVMAHNSTNYAVLQNYTQ